MSTLVNCCFMEVNDTGECIAFQPVQAQRGQVAPKYNEMSIWSELLPENSSKVTEALCK